ncbi:MAG: hypothetical protein IJ770_01055 [Alphaproteobacteria bacterium]|nr:hypothetical protein [Alphaproteobacteria bacterium]
MLKHIFVLSLALLFIPHKQSFAQLDLDALMQDTATEDAAVEQTAENTDEPTLDDAENTEPEETAPEKDAHTEPTDAIEETADITPDESEETEKEILTEQTETNNIEPVIAPQENSSDNVDITQQSANTAPSEPILQNDQPDKDNFMVEYFDEVDAAEAQDKAAHKAQSDAYRLIGAEPTMVTIPEEQQKLLQLTEKRRKQRERELQKKQEENTKTEGNISLPTEDNQQSSVFFQAFDTTVETAADTAKTEKAQNTEQPVVPEKAAPTYEKAPFGLYWGMPKEETENLGFEFRPAKLENQTNVYVAENTKQPQKQFASVVTVFGEKNRLNAVYAEGIFATDTPKAENVLKLYDRYYAALKKKYGGDHEYFKAAVYEEQIEVPNINAEPAPIKNKPKEDMSEGGNTQIEEDTPDIPKTVVKTLKKDKPRGNDNFLQELQEGKASLFATFGKEKIKVTLAIEVNPELQSRITLDYENSEIQQQDKEAALNELMDDL